MRKYAVIGLSIFISAALWANSLMGKRQISYDADTVVVKVGDCDVTVSEVMIHFLKWRSEIESRWGRDMWKAQTGTNSDGTPILYEENIKDDIAQEITVEKSLYQIAKSKGLKLTKKEKEACKTQAEKWIRRFPNEDMITFEITTEKVVSYCEEISLIEKLYPKQMAAIQDESDSSQLTSVDGLFFLIYEEDDEGNRVPFDSKTKNMVYKNAQAAVEELKSGESVEKVAQEYHLDYSGERTYLSSEMEGDFWDQIKNLEDGEVSNVLTTDQGYAVIKMVHKVDSEKMEIDRDQNIEKKKREVFEKYYKKKYKNKYHTKIQEDLWEELPLASDNEET